MAFEKWTILVLACIVTFGAYYSFDTPSVLHNQLFRHFRVDGETRARFEFDFSLVYSVYSLPNTLLPLVGGLLVDKIGNKNVMLSFGAFVVLGNAIQTFGCLTKNIYMYIFGRFVFGFGSETLNVCVNTIISKWFRGQELAFALAINLSACKLGGVLNDWISPAVEGAIGLNWTIFLVTILCVVCYGFSAYLAYNEPETVPLPEYVHVPTVSSDTAPLPHGFSSYQQSGDVEMVQSSCSSSSSQQEDEEAVDEYCTKRSVLLRFSLAAWLLFVLNFLMYGVYVPFNNLSNPILLEFYFPPTQDPALQHAYEIKSALLQSIPYFVSVVLNPVLGISIDYFGRRTAQMAIATVLLFVGHGLILEHAGSALVPLCLIGFSYSVYGCVAWACVPLVVEAKLTGTAFGLMAAFQNSGQFVAPLILSYLIKEAGGYSSCEQFFMALAALSLVITLWLWIVDERYENGALRAPTEEFAAHEGDQAAADGQTGVEHGTSLGSVKHVLAEPTYGATSGTTTIGGRQYTASTSIVETLHQFTVMFRSSTAVTTYRPIGADDELDGHGGDSGRQRLGSHGGVSDGGSSRNSSRNSSDPIAIIPLPMLASANVIPTTEKSSLGSFTLAGQFPRSDSLELRRQISERSRLVPHSFIENNRFSNLAHNKNVAVSLQDHQLLTKRFSFSATSVTEQPEQPYLEGIALTSNHHQQNISASSPEFANRKKLKRSNSFRDFNRLF